jgi:quinolinate synthase
MIEEEISRLKKEKNAIILAHYYQEAEVQDVADYVGDSLELSRIAAKTTADTIVFCGVNFMAETAKILSPEKKVLLPVKEAKCPMAMMVDAPSLGRYRQEHPERVVICYVNSYADVKALSDVCVTSANAEKIVMNFKDRKILYVPDRNLGTYLRDKYALDIEVWPGFCCIHNNLRVSQILEMKQKHPDAEVLIHPEAPLKVLKYADFIGSTKQILDYATASANREFIIGTEEGILHPLRKRNPEKRFHLLSPALSCFDMKLTHLDDVLNALRNETCEITVPEETLQGARRALDRMMEMS